LISVEGDSSLLPDDLASETETWYAQNIIAATEHSQVGDLIGGLADAAARSDSMIQAEFRTIGGTADRQPDGQGGSPPYTRSKLTELGDQHDTNLSSETSLGSDRVTPSMRDHASAYVPLTILQLGHEIQIGQDDDDGLFYKFIPHWSMAHWISDIGGPENVRSAPNLSSANSRAEYSDRIRARRLARRAGLAQLYQENPAIIDDYDTARIPEGYIGADPLEVWAGTQIENQTAAMLDGIDIEVETERYKEQSSGEFCSFSLESEFEVADPQDAEPVKDSFVSIAMKEIRRLAEDGDIKDCVCGKVLEDEALTDMPLNHFRRAEILATFEERGGNLTKDLLTYVESEPENAEFLRHQHKEVLKRDTFRSNTDTSNGIVTVEIDTDFPVSRT
jgi:hypothetical protein